MINDEAEGLKRKRLSPRAARCAEGRSDPAAIPHALCISGHNRPVPGRDRADSADPEPANNRRPAVVRNGKATDAAQIFMVPSLGHRGSET
jgi:hypothetical protein